MKTIYDPAASFELKVSEVEFRRTEGGRQLMARVYQPQGPGPFPTVLDLHGGAWRRKHRFAEEPMDRAMAASGALVVAIDLRLSEEAPYPASVQDAHYGVRWLKSKAAGWNGDPSKLGVYGSSSGGHVAQPTRGIGSSIDPCAKTSPGRRTRARTFSRRPRPRL